MKPITWLRKFANRGDQGHPVATLAFYGPDDKKASKAVLGIIPSKDSEAQLHKWFRESPDADLRYDIKLQNCSGIIRRKASKHRDARGNKDSDDEDGISDWQVVRHALLGDRGRTSDGLDRGAATPDRSARCSARPAEHVHRTRSRPANAGRAGVHLPSEDGLHRT